MATDIQDNVNAFAEVFSRHDAPNGPLSGMTFAVKDLFDLAGRIAGCGNPEWARTHEAAEKDAWAVARVLGAGADLKGMTHTDELAYSLMGVNVHYGTPVNSADPRRVPGGSSSGSAAAVAAGLVDFALGSDTGGSVRIPASFCGIWGLRTTFGLVPVDGVMPFTRSFDTVGWFAREGGTMQSVAKVLGCPDAAPVTRLLLPVDVWARANVATVAAVAPSLDRLQATFGTVTPVLLADEGLDAWREVFRICQAGEVWDLLGNWVSANEPNFGPGIEDRFQMAAGIDPHTFAVHDNRRVEIARRMEALVPEGSLLVMPTGPAPGPFLEAKEDDLNGFRTRALEMLCPAGLAGLPQLSVPAGIVNLGPVGISLVGGRQQDRALIDAAMTAGLGREL